MQVFDQQHPSAPLISSHSPHKRKRGPRASIACESCRRLKAKCDQRTPCCVCMNNSLECIYRSTRSSIGNAAALQAKRPVLGAHVTTGNETVQSQYGISQERIQQKKADRTNTGSKALSTGNSDSTNFTTIAPRPSNQRSLHSPKSALNDHGFSGDTEGETECSVFPIVEDYEREPLEYDATQKEPATEPELSPNGFGEVNKNTSGTEFYGPTATLAFLIELRSRARAFQSQTNQNKNRAKAGNSEESASRNLSIIDFFHNDDDDAAPDANQIQANTGYASVENTPGSFSATSIESPNIELEKECIQLYFANLHLIYVILDKDDFMARCEDEIWAPSLRLRASARQKSSRFPALYNAVVAVGAITAGDDTPLVQNLGKVQTFLNHRSNEFRPPSGGKQPTYPPLELGQRYFAKARALLGDFLEVCSIQSTQALFLMSIFCQYTLKPHGCYMYSGMAARTALAIGSPNEPDLRKTSIDAIRTWWCMYYHEIEVCCSLGRETFLREPDYYPVFMAKFGEPMPIQYAHPDNENTFWARSMTELAHILKRTSDEIYHTASTVSRRDRSQVAISLDERLSYWKSQLSPMYDLDSESLTERESVTKRKVVLKLRFYSARILIHRPFLVAAAYQGSSASFADNLKLCLDASRETIHLLYDTFVNRPFFRTWWYNTTYAFNAITIILYTLVSPIQKQSSDELLKDVEKTLKIFQAMDGISVARRCAKLTQEIFEVAKASLQEQRSQTQTMLSSATQHGTASQEGTAAAPLVPAPHFHIDTNMWGEFGNIDGLQDDFFASLIDPNILDTFGANLDGLDLDFSPS